MIKNNKGYNLLMLSIIVLALSIMMSAVLRFYNITNYKRRILTTTSRFEEIDLAIKSYVAKYSRFPCPAPLDCNKNSCGSSNNQIGIEKRDSGGNCVIESGIFESTNASSNKIYYGGIPALTLGLANNYIVDGWGNKIVYIIPEELTKNSSYHIFLYAKNHPDISSIEIKKEIHNINREYIQDGMVYLLISFNRNTEGAYLYDNKRVNRFPSGMANYPTPNFTIDTSNKKFLFYSKDYNNFKIDGLEEEMQICPDLTIEFETEYDMTFESGKYGEIVFSNKLCPSNVSIPAEVDDYYYLSNYIAENGILIDNRAAKKCGKNGEWEDGFVYECILLSSSDTSPSGKCVKPKDDERYSSLDWGTYTFPVSNMGEVQDEEGKIRLKCIYTKDGAKWYRINLNDGD